MKKQRFIKLLTLVFLLTAGIQAQAQKEIADFLKGGVADGEKLIQAYLQPLGYAMGANLNGGWYNTAKVHKTLGFDITLSISAALVPEIDKSFDLTTLGFENLRLQNQGAGSEAPTFAGNSSKLPVLEYAITNPVDNSEIVLASFKTLNGINVPGYPLPMLKAGVGLPAGFEINARFLPRISYEDMSLGLWGAGIKYDVFQHIPLVGKLPVLNVSLFGAYTQVNSSTNLSFQKSRYQSMIGDKPVTGGKDLYENQTLDISLRGFKGMALASVDIPVITVFAGIGYSQSFTNIDMLGEYPLIQFDQTTTDIYIQDVTDPIALKFDNFSGLQLNAGIRLKLAVITLHADYTYANYNMITAGIGLSIR